MEGEKLTTIIDNGTGTIKAGFAGEDYPRSIFPTIIGRPKYFNTVNIQSLSDWYFGDDTEMQWGILKTSNPIEAGYVKNWDDMEKIWEHTFYNELRVSPEEHSMMLTEAPLNLKKNREISTQIMFEVFNVPNFYLVDQWVSALYAAGRTTGLVLSSGEEVTNIVPVYEGYSLPHAVRRIMIAGKDITKYLIKILQERTISLYGASEFKIANDIKEKWCNVIQRNFDEALKESNENDFLDRTYCLPWGSTIYVKNESFRAPEILFRPQLIGMDINGIHSCIFDSILNCDVDIRRELTNSILLTGGTTMFEGFKDRIWNEIKSLAPLNYEVKVIAPGERKYDTWIGCTILASLTTFQDMWIKKSEYEESGPRIIHRKWF